MTDHTSTTAPLAPQSSANDDARAGWRSAILITVIYAVIFCLLASASSLWDRDEPRFARAAVEMVESGNYLFPTFNGDLRPDKPILIYWLMSVPLRLLGQIELAVRLPSILGLCGSMLLTYYMGRRLIDTRAGLIAMLVLATTPLSTAVGTAATADGTLLLCLTASLALLLRCATSPWGWRETVMLGFVLGLAQLTKGPVGVAIPVLAALAATWLARKDVTKARLSWPALTAAVLIGFAMFAAWGVPANMATGGEFAQRGLGKHVLGRSLKPMEGHGGNWFVTLPFYIPVVIAGFFPWTLYLMGGWSLTSTGAVGGRAVRAILLGWPIAVFALMSVVATKLPHYVLPMWPALALMVAATIRAHQLGTLSDKQRTLTHRGGMLFAPVWVGVIAALAVGPWLSHHAVAMRGPCACLAVIVLIAGGWSLREHLAYRFDRAAIGLGAGMMLVQIVLTLWALPAIETLKPARPMAREIQKLAPPDVRVGTIGFEEPSLFFYLDRGRVEGLSAKRLPAFLAEPGPRVVLLSRKAMHDLTKRGVPVNLPVIAERSGANYSNGSWVELVAMLRSAEAAPATAPSGE